jgi:uncharacterized membrane protein
MGVKSLKKQGTILFALFALALCSRLPGISFHSLWFDETSTANMVSQATYGDMLEAINTIEGTPPLFFYLERAFISVFNLPVNETSLRALPMLFGVLSCILFFVLFRNLGGTAIGWQAFLLFTCSSYLINQAQEARCYSFLGFMALVTMYAVFRWWKSSGLKNSIFLCSVVALTVQIHYHAMLWIAALFLAVFITKPKNKQLGLFFLYSGAAAVISLATLIPLLLVQAQFVIAPHKDYLTQKWLIGLVYVPVKVMIGSYLFKITSIRDITSIDLIGIIPVIAMLGISAFYIAKQFRDRSLSDERKILIFNVVIPFLLFAGIGWKVAAVHPRYMAHFTALILGILLLALERARIVRAAFIIMLLTLNVIGIVKYYDSSRAYIEPWREIGRAVDDIAASGHSPGDVIITDMPIAHTVAFYSRNTTIPIYQIPSFFDPLPVTHIRLFGHDYYATMLNFFHYPIVGHTSMAAVMREKKTGIFLNKKKSGHTKTAELDRDFEGLVSFTLLRYFYTNQGDVCIYRWNYEE